MFSNFGSKEVRYLSFLQGDLSNQMSCWKELHSPNEYHKLAEFHPNKKIVQGIFLLEEELELLQ